jgi:hypothetical protein
MTAGNWPTLPAPCSHECNIGATCRPKAYKFQWRIEFSKSLHPGSIPGEASIHFLSSSFSAGLRDAALSRCSLLPFRRSLRTTKDLRQRLTSGRSRESTSNPSGSIQNPSTGRKPRTPPRMRPTPSAIRKDGCRGRPNTFDPIRISPRPALNVKNFFRVIVTRAVRGG